MSYQPGQTPALGVIMSNPTLLRQMREAWDAPAGSTKRLQARATLRMIRKVGQRKGVIQDGQGGDPYVGSISPSGSLTPAIPFADPNQTGTTAARVSDFTGPVQPNIIPSIGQMINGTATSSSAIQFDSKGNVIPSTTSAPTGGTSSMGNQLGLSPGTSLLTNIDDILNPKRILDTQPDVNSYITGTSKTLTPADVFGVKTTLTPTPPPPITYINKTGSIGPMPAVTTPSVDRITDNKNGTYSYKNNDGTTHTGPWGDKYADRTQPSFVGPVAPVGWTKPVYLTSLLDNVLNTVAPDRNAYLAKLDTNTRAAAIQMLKLIDSGYTKDMAVSNIMSNLDTMQQMFPGIPRDSLPVGSMPEEALYNIREALKQKLDTDGLAKKMNAMQDNQIPFNTEITDYIKSQDSYLTTLDGLLNKARNFQYSGRGLTDIESRLNQNYMQYLTAASGAQKTRYIDWLNTANTNYTNSINLANQRYTQTMNMIDKDVNDITPWTTAKYNTYKTYINGMYDQLSLITSNSNIRTAASETQMKTAASVISDIASLHKVAASVLSPTDLELFDKNMGVSGASYTATDQTAISNAYSNIGTPATATDTAGARSVYGAEKDGVVTINDSNLYNVLDKAVTDSKNVNTVAKNWTTDVGTQIFQKAQSSYSMSEVEKYEAEMKKLKESPDFYTNDKKRAAFYAMNNTIYQNYIDGIKSKLSKDPKQTDEIKLYIDRLSHMNYSDIVQDGKVKPGAEQFSIDGGWFGPTIRINPDLQKQLWQCFVYKVLPPAFVTAVLGPDVAIKPADVFNGFLIPGASQVENVMKTLLDYYEKSSITEDYAKTYGTNSAAAPTTKTAGTGVALDGSTPTVTSTTTK